MPLKAWWQKVPLLHSGGYTASLLSRSISGRGPCISLQSAHIPASCAAGIAHSNISSKPLNQHEFLLPTARSHATRLPSKLRSHTSFSKTGFFPKLHSDSSESHCPKCCYYMNPHQTRSGFNLCLCHFVIICHEKQQ